MTSASADRVATAVRRVNLISGVAEAAVDVRKACNGIKRMSALAGASAARGVPINKMVDAAQEVALGALKAIGYDVADEKRCASVLPMMLESASVVLAHVVEEGKFDDVDRAVEPALAAMVHTARSRLVSKSAEAAWPADMDSVMAMRLTTVAAIGQVAMEVDRFDFMHKPSECIKEATKFITESCAVAAAAIAPKGASGASRLVLSQTLVQSAARLYATVWQGVADQQAADLDAMSEPEREERLDVMAAAPLGDLLAAVHERFEVALAAVVESAIAQYRDTSPAEETLAPAKRRKP